MRHYYLTQRFQPTLLNVRTLRQYISNLFGRMAVDSEKSGQIQLIVSELLVNFVDHSDPVPTEVITRIHRDVSGWVLEILDNGGEFVDFAEKIASADNDPMSEGGRGLFLLREYFPDFNYSQVDDDGKRLNCLTVNLGHLEDHRPALLLVDDDEAHSQLLYYYLQESFRVTLCPNVEAAFAALAKDSIDLILSDIQMPGCSGLEFRQRLISEGISDSIPFLFITSQQDDSVGYTAAELHIDDYLIKPVKKEQLNRVVRRVLKRSAQVKLQLVEHFGRQLTQMLRPKLAEKMGALDCAWYDQAAEAGGGDMILGEYQKDRSIVFFADLMGHGIQAKFYAHALAGYVRGMVVTMDADATAGDLLTRLSAAFFSDKVLSATLMTCVVLVVHNDGRIEIANGGQPEPMISTEGGWDALPINGCLPGLIDNCEYETYKLRLAPGQKLLISSDGLWEFGSNVLARDQHVKSINQALNKVAMKGTLHEQSAQFIEDFGVMVANRPSDDVTLLLLANPESP